MSVWHLCQICISNPHHLHRAVCRVADQHFTHSSINVRDLALKTDPGMVAIPKLFANNHDAPSLSNQSSIITLPSDAMNDAAALEASPINKKMGLIMKMLSHWHSIYPN